MKLKNLFGRKKQSRPASSANEFMLESLEPRLLLSATPMTAAVVTTDHLDYAPGETAVITTSNQDGDGLQFTAGEMVRFQVSRTDGMADAAGTTAMSDRPATKPGMSSTVSADLPPIWDPM